MSAFMVNNSTLSKIAKYMEACANYKIGSAQGLWDLELDKDFKKLLAAEGLVDETTGEFSASLIHSYLYRRNFNALCFRYGEKETKETLCPSEPVPLDDKGTAEDVSYENRKVWLSNLYTVCRCYLYQIAEGDYLGDMFYRKFGEWISQMAAALARFVVDEVRPSTGGLPNKSWDEF